MTLPVRNTGDVEVDIDAKVRLSSGGAGGFLFDFYGPSDFKYVTLDVAAGAVNIGHHIGSQWAIDANFAVAISAGVDAALSVSLNGTSVTVSVNGVVVGSFSYYGAVADGGLGTISQTGSTSFDDVHIVFGTHVDNTPDSQPPSITTPGNITRSADAGKSTTVITDATLGTATATDNVGLASLVRSGVPAGNVFAIGVTAISWTATDIFGNVNVVAQLVTVVDTEKPVLTVPAAVTRQVAAGGTSIVVTDAELGSASATDNSGSATIVRTGVPAGNVFPVGTTTITYTATDAAGNVSTATQTVTVSQPVPVISVGVTDASGNEYLRDPIVFTITRSGSTTGSITINLGWSGTAVLGTDYTVTATGGTLGGSGTTITLAAGVTSATVTVTPTDDTTVESTRPSR